MKTLIKFLFVLIIIFTISSGEVGAFGQDCPSGQTCIDNPLGDDTTPESIIGNVINAILGISGSLALLMFVYGGFTWMLSGGSPEKVTKGKNTLVWATIGLVVIFSSYALVNFVFQGLGSATS